MDHKSPSCAWQPHRANVKGLHHILSLSFFAPRPHKKNQGNSKWSASIFLSHQVITPSGKRVVSLSTSCCERVGPRCEGVGTGAGCTGRILVEVGRRQKIFGRRDLDAQLWHVYCLLSTVYYMYIHIYNIYILHDPIMRCHVRISVLSSFPWADNWSTVGRNGLCNVDSSEYSSVCDLEGGTHVQYKSTYSITYDRLMQNAFNLHIENRKHMDKLRMMRNCMCSHCMRASTISVRS